MVLSTAKTLKALLAFSTSWKANLSNGPKSAKGMLVARFCWLELVSCAHCPPAPSLVCVRLQPEICSPALVDCKLTVQGQFAR